VVLGPQGSVLKQGSFADLNPELEHLNKMVHTNHTSQDDRVQEHVENPQAVTSTQPTTALNSTRQTGDISTYKYYASFIGWHRGIFFVFFLVGHIFFVTFPRTYYSKL
jgi:hypothetical protein